MDASAPTFTTSMQRDVAAGSTSEFSGLVDRVVALDEKNQRLGTCVEDQMTAEMKVIL